MTTPENPDSLSNLSGSLSAEYDQSRAAQRDRVIAELKQVIERVPEQTEFTNSRRYKVWGPVMLLVALGMLALAFNMGKTGMIVAALFVTLVSAVISWQHRNAGTHVFLRLTRRQLFVDTLDAPVDLAQVEEVAIKDEGLVTMQTLNLSDDAVLPDHRVARLQFFGNQTMVIRKPRLQLRILSAGLAIGGRKLDNEEALALLAAYRDAAHAQRQLEALQANG